MMLSMYENDTTLYMIAHIHKEKGKVKEFYRIIAMMADGSIGVDMTRCAKLGDLKSMQERLDDIADANEWRWHGKRKAPYEIEDLFGLLDKQDYFTIELGERGVVK